MSRRSAARCRQEEGVPSHAYRWWSTVRARELDEIKDAHTSVGGGGPGRRYATQQINRAYAVLLASQFQGFCRDIHTEVVDALVAIIPLVAFRITVREEFLWNRQLDRGNAHQTSIANDFSRLAIPDFWRRVDAVAVGNDRRRLMLDALNSWRNAIAHQDFDPARLGGTTILRLRTVTQWRRSCHILARSMDVVLRAYVLSVRGTAPW